ncbi:MAG: hypothetical protein NT069_22565 [Planctomycetota bacterium]|nr:hypothetical protein [Planctomycetota bacterium]
MSGPIESTEEMAHATPRLPLTLEHYGLSREVVEQKIQRYLELLRISRELALAGLRHQHPTASHKELERLFAKRVSASQESKWRGARESATTD